jgi:DNA-binding NarL/FixJ family response regulator
LIRVVVVARGLPLRTGLRAIVEEGEQGARMIGDAASLQAIDALTWEAVDVLLLDGDSLPEDALTSLPSETLPGTVMLGGTRGQRAALLGSGTPAGLLSADASSEQIHAAIAAVAAGLTVTESAAETLPRAPRGDDDSQVEAELTPREREVLTLVAVGLPNKGIAARLGISEHTVKFHLASVLSKLGAASRAEAVARAARLGLIAL